MTITAKELNEAIRANDHSVFVDGGGTEFKVSVEGAVQEESHFTVPGLIGLFKCVSVGRDPLEPDSYPFVYEYDGQHFAVFGYYDSWQGVEIDDTSFSEVHLVEHIVKTWDVKK